MVKIMFGFLTFFSKRLLNTLKKSLKALLSMKLKSIANPKFRKVLLNTTKTICYCCINIIAKILCLILCVLRMVLPSGINIWYIYQIDNFKQHQCGKLWHFYWKFRETNHKYDIFQARQFDFKNLYTRCFHKI